MDWFCWENLHQKAWSNYLRSGWWCLAFPVKIFPGTNSGSVENCKRWLGKLGHVSVICDKMQKNNTNVTGKISKRKTLGCLVVSSRGQTSVLRNDMFVQYATSVGSMCKMLLAKRNNLPKLLFFGTPPLACFVLIFFQDLLAKMALA